MREEWETCPSSLILAVLDVSSDARAGQCLLLVSTGLFVHDESRPSKPAGEHPSLEHQKERNINGSQQHARQRRTAAEPTHAAVPPGFKLQRHARKMAKPL